MELESVRDHSKLSLLSEAPPPTQTQAKEQAVDMEELEAEQELRDGDADGKHFARGECNRLILHAYYTGNMQSFPRFSYSI